MCSTGTCILLFFDARFQLVFDQRQLFWNVFEKVNALKSKWPFALISV